MKNDKLGLKEDLAVFESSDNLRRVHRSSILIHDSTTREML